MFAYATSSTLEAFFFFKRGNLQIQVYWNCINSCVESPTLPQLLHMKSKQLKLLNRSEHSRKWLANGLLTLPLKQRLSFI
jgi:hypothetical protein